MKAMINAGKSIDNEFRFGYFVDFIHKSIDEGQIVDHQLLVLLKTATNFYASFDYDIGKEIVFIKGEQV